MCQIEGREELTICHQHMQQMGCAPRLAVLGQLHQRATYGCVQVLESSTQSEAEVRLSDKEVRLTVCFTDVLPELSSSCTFSNIHLCLLNKYVYHIFMCMQDMERLVEFGFSTAASHGSHLT